MWRNEAIRWPFSRGGSVNDRSIGSLGQVSSRRPPCARLANFAGNLPVPGTLPISFRDHDFEALRRRLGHFFLIGERLQSRAPRAAAFGRAARVGAQRSALESSVDRGRRAHARKRLRGPWQRAAALLRTLAYYRGHGLDPIAME